MNAADKLKAAGIRPKAVAYARYSSDNQRAESIDAQLRAIEEYAQKNGIQLVEKYIDRAISGTSDNRPEFQRMICDAANEDFHIVIVHKLDRFSRKRLHAIGYQVELKKHGVSVISVLEPLDEDAPESVILESVLEGMNEYYSRNLSREVMKGMRENALQCLHVGGIPPLGYDVDSQTKKYRVNERESQAVRFIFQSVLDGKGYLKTIDELNAMGMRTKTGGRFGKNSLYDILRNEKYRGIYVFNRSAAMDADHKRNNHRAKPENDIIRIEDGVPRIVSDEVFFKVQELMDSRKRMSIHGKGKEVYLLSGKIVCGECGAGYCGNSRVGGRSKRRLVTYRCNNRANRTSIVCRNKEVNRDYLERFVLNVLADILFDVEYVPKLITDYNRYIQEHSGEKMDTLRHIQNELAKTARKIDNLTDAVAETGNHSLITGLEKEERRKAELEVRINELTRQMKTVVVPEKDIRIAFQRAKELFQSGELSQTRQLINLYVDHVTVYMDRIDITLNPIGMLAASRGQGEPARMAALPVEEFFVEQSVSRVDLNGPGSKSV